MQSSRHTTRFLRLRGLNLGLPLLLWLLVNLAKADPADYVRDVVPLLTKYCAECHTPPKSKGDLNLLRFETLEAAREVPTVWFRIRKRLAEREMPPGDRPKPTEEERKLIFAWIDAMKPPERDCNQLASDESKGFYHGYVMSRRLNRLEYHNTVRDLFYGLDVDADSDFPADGSGGEGFDNNGDTLFSSPILVEHYLRAADAIVETAFPSAIEAGDVGAARRRELIFTARPGGETGLSSVQAASAVLDGFLRRAYRRPLEPDDIFPLLALFTSVAHQDADYESGLKYALRGALVSPDFLFLTEPVPVQSEGVQPLSSYPLAARLAYFLWASMPDDELSALADSGLLQDPEVVRGQVRRMLADPRSRGLAESFAPQWLGLRALGGSVRPDSTLFSGFDDELESAMREEPIALFDDLIRHDRSLLELIDSDSVFVNERLAEHYGIEGVKGEEIREVKVNNANRGGVLGLGAALTVTSHPLRTSPVLRGKWVLEQILGESIPPPPPNVGTLPEDGHNPEALTLRQQMEQHRRNPECASCHQRMDPIGFGLENFDPIGRWRTEQGGKRIDATGVLPSGEQFSSPAELKKVILARKDQFLANITRQMLGYALGRGLNEFDKCVIEEALKNLKANENRPPRSSKPSR